MHTIKHTHKLAVTILSDDIFNKHKSHKKHAKKNQNFESE